MYFDDAGRINCENLTTKEWALLEKAKLRGGWFLPTDQDWLDARGVLALIDIRRGFDYDVDRDVYRLGPANIRINKHGKLALKFRKLGKFYTFGEPLTQRQIDELIEDEGIR